MSDNNRVFNELLFDCDGCPVCRSTLYAYTHHQESGHFYEGDDVVCQTCGVIGRVMLGASEHPYIAYNKAPGDQLFSSEIGQAGSCKLCQRHCRDWAEDHTQLQNLCRKAGFSEAEVEGDKYRVPGIMELADMLFSKINEGNSCESWSDKFHDECRRRGVDLYEGEANAEAVGDSPDQRIVETKEKE